MANQPATCSIGHVPFLGISCQGILTVAFTMTYHAILRNRTLIRGVKPVNVKHLMKMANYTSCAALHAANTFHAAAAPTPGSRAPIAGLPARCVPQVKIVLEHFLSFKKSNSPANNWKYPFLVFGGVACGPLNIWAPSGRYFVYTTTPCNGEGWPTLDWAPSRTPLTEGIFFVPSPDYLRNKASQRGLECLAEMHLHHF